MMTKDDAFNLGYEMARGKTAYENEQGLIVIGAIAALVVIGLIGFFVIDKIEKYQEKKRIEEKKRKLQKRKVKNEIR